MSIALLGAASARGLPSGAIARWSAAGLSLGTLSTTVPDLTGTTGALSVEQGTVTVADHGGRRYLDSDGVSGGLVSPALSALSGAWECTFAARLRLTATTLGILAEGSTTGFDHDTLQLAILAGGAANLVLGSVGESALRDWTEDSASDFSAGKVVIVRLSRGSTRGIARDLRVAGVTRSNTLGPQSGSSFSAFGSYALRLLARSTGLYGLAGGVSEPVIWPRWLSDGECAAVESLL